VALVCKCRNGLAGGGVQGVKEVHHADENPFVFAIGPVGETPRFGCVPRMPESNFHTSLPVPASNAETLFCVGVIP